MARFIVDKPVVVVICVILLCLTPPTSGFLNPLKHWLGMEVCTFPNLRRADTAVELLEESLAKDLFGQHLASRTVLTAVKMHLDENLPKKALVLSLHGWSGSGKTFTTQLIVKALYEKGEQSQFFKFFSATYHFPDAKKVREYQQSLLEEVKKTVKQCERALLVFDEVDKLPAGLLDVLTPLIKPLGNLEEGLNVKKAIFIFLSNSGATKINSITEQALLEGRVRETLELKDFEQVLSNEAFDSSGGLYKSELIEKILVDWFVPFLPLERYHVKQCARRDAVRMGGGVGGFKAVRLDDEQVEEIANRLTYWPEDKKWFSATGCKRVESLVKFMITEASFNQKRGRAKSKKEL